MTDITIPDEALEAAARAQYEFWRHDCAGELELNLALYRLWAELEADEQERWIEQTRAACLAMLKHWPGMTTDGRELHFSTARGAPVTTVKAYSIILPLPQENTNAEG